MNLSKCLKSTLERLRAAINRFPGLEISARMFSLDISAQDSKDLGNA